MRYLQRATRGPLSDFTEYVGQSSASLRQVIGMLPLLRGPRRFIIFILACAPALPAQPRASGPTTASVSGTVFDSLTARVLGGAAVQLVRQGTIAGSTLTVTSDSMGRYRFAKVVPGRYALGFLHPALDALGFEPEPVSVLVAPGSTRRVNLAIPAATTLRLALCGDGAVRDSTALVLGFARRARNRAPLDSVIVTVAWRPRGAGARDVPQPTPQRRVAASPSGWFVVCAAQGGDTIRLTARRNNVTVTTATLTIPESGLLQHDVLLNDEPAPAVAVQRLAGDSTAASPGAAGTLPVDGVVIAADGGRPIVGAIIGIVGGAVTRSDAQGAWRIIGVSRGTQTLTVRALRYAPLTVTIDVAQKAPQVRLGMTLLQGVLDTVNVVDEAVTDSNLAEFLERRRTRGSGTFLSAEDIHSRRPTHISELFVAIQGGITIQRDSVGNKFLTMRSNTLRSDRCIPAIFIDGMSMRGLTTGDLDGLVRPTDLFGIEVYRAANAPVEFSEQDGCGTILVWTKR